MTDITDQQIRDFYQVFLDEVFDKGVIWGLMNDDGWAVCQSNDFEEREVIPFWSAENRAQMLCDGEWGSYKPTAITYDDFIDAWLHGMHEDEVLVGLNWNVELIGPELEPLVVMDDLLDEE